MKVRTSRDGTPAEKLLLYTTELEPREGQPFGHYVEEHSEKSYITRWVKDGTKTASAIVRIDANALAAYVRKALGTKRLRSTFGNGAVVVEINKATIKTHPVTT